MLAEKSTGWRQQEIITTSFAFMYFAVLCISKQQVTKSHFLIQLLSALSLLKLTVLKRQRPLSLEILKS